MLLIAAFHLGLHCLPKYPFRVFSIQRVNEESFHVNGVSKI